MSTQQEEMSKRFDEKFGESFCNEHEIRPCKECGNIKSFIQSEIDLAIANRDKEIVEMIKETQEKFRSVDKKTKEETYSGGGKCRSCDKRKDALEVETILSLITKKLKK